MIAEPIAPKIMLRNDNWDTPAKHGSFDMFLTSFRYSAVPLKLFTTPDSGIKKLPGERKSVLDLQLPSQSTNDPSGYDF